ncbi:type-F conjugative transfer system mating-pair stabilization protein TraN (plasmid) [Cedecea neteri]|uniref:type-F conjugative transfer system mating-pair stabilization protein TraN n=1 Tax=Cedecea neteri TaxID=158822 RepID=UPI0028936477|nr:type-F conjugative transfer system mating-pair stabilization protein TraN [Cedecea neteri]WNJ82284.1 type-F conjugative transfer system mating-pair stabilization protein TraN [Cedecea neteri]
MKRILAAALLLFPLLSSAADPAFNDGANFGKGNAGQGTGSLQNPGVITGSIPGYTSTPPESGYYGGVTGGDGGIGGKGQTAIGNNQAGGAIIDSGNKNPPVKIDPNAPFITIGKDAESTAGSVVDGTNPQCSATSVSKTTFENFSCDRDLGSVEACARTANVSGHLETASTTETITVTHDHFSFNYDGDMGLYFRFTYPQTGTVLSATVSWTPMKNLGSRGFDVWFWGGNTHFNLNAFSFALPGAVGAPFNGTSPDGFMSTTNCPASLKSFCRHAAADMVNNLNAGNARMQVVFTIQTTTQKWVPDVSYQETCTFNKNNARLIGSVCSSPGGDRQITQNGQTYTVHSDCWEYTDSYIVPSTSPGNCGSLTSNPSCTLALKNCTQTDGGTCLHQSETYQCQTTHTSTGMLCGGDYICKSGDCDGTNGAGDAGFDTAVAKLAGLASAGEDVRNGQNQMDVRAFTGTAMSCRKAFAGFNNCCKDSGWGQDTGLAACNSDEMAIGKAKAKKVTVSLGERCDHSVLGVCIQKSQVYCVFQGKLARIIQEQGRRDQLGVGFGSGDSPNCSGITVPQLQSINFDLINFSDFYEDLMANQKVPDSDAMVKQVKDRIAAQVNAQTGGK